MRTGQRPLILLESPARESPCSKVDLPLHRSGFRIVQPADARFPSFRNWPFSAFPLRTEKIGAPAKRTAPLIDILGISRRVEARENRLTAKKRRRYVACVARERVQRTEYGRVSRRSAPVEWSLRNETDEETCSCRCPEVDSPLGYAMRL